MLELPSTSRKRSLRTLIAGLIASLLLFGIILLTVGACRSPY
jgi:hypothetical protein